MRKNSLALYFFVVALALFSLCVGGGEKERPPMNVSYDEVYVVRDLPECARPGEYVRVSLSVGVDEEHVPSAAGVEELYPEGWVVENVTAGGRDPSGGMVEWLFWGFGEPVVDRNLTYYVHVPRGAEGRYAFNGRFIYGQTKIETGGDVSVDVRDSC